jgi:aspartate/methionine/tyrosine aminotransferase
MNQTEPHVTFPASARRLDAVQEYYFSAKLREIAQMNGEGGEPVINLGIGSPDLPPDPSVINTLQEATRQPEIHRYQSYRGIPDLREAFAAWYARWWGVTLDPESELLPLIGSKEGIMHIAMAFLEPGLKALVPDPSYPAYRAASLLAGAEVVSYALEEEKGWLPDLEKLEAQDLSQVRIMWLNYPNMPTGADAHPAFFEELVAFAIRNEILLVNDNPYGFILRENPLSILRTPGAKSVALELNSLSKSHNLAGWRVGILSGAPHRIETVLRFKSNMDSGMFKAIQLAAIQALQLGPEWYRSLNQVYRKRQAAIHHLLDGLNCTYDPGAGGMFVWARSPQGDGFALSDQVLYGSRVFLTPGGIFGDQGRAFIRLSLCQPLEVIEAARQRMEKTGILKINPKKQAE